MFNQPSRSSIIFILVNILLLVLNSAHAQPPVISYPTPKNYVINNPITPLNPTNSGGAVPQSIYGQVGTMPIYGFNNVTGMATDLAGNLYIQDWGGHVIKKYTPQGEFTLFAGSGQPGKNDGQGTAASFNRPGGIVIDAAGNLYVSDQGNYLIRKITPTGLVTTFAGTGVSGSADGIGLLASFNIPRGSVIDKSGNIYIADQENHKIRKVTPEGAVTTFAGSGSMGISNSTGTSATFNTPTGVGIDASGNLYIADAGNNAIRKITPAGEVSTYASGFSFPRDVKIDASGFAYVTNQNNSTISRISPEGTVTTFAGNGQSGSVDGIGQAATFHGPIFLEIDHSGSLLVGDNGNGLIRKINILGYTIDKALPAGLNFDPTTGFISGTPTALSPLTNYEVTAYNKSGNSITIVSIEVSDIQPSVITFPPPITFDIDADNILHPGATSTNSETPITYTSSNPAVAYLGTDGQIHVIAPGITVITAFQAGNSNFTAATPVERTFTIKQYQVIQFPLIAPKLTCDIDFHSGALSSNPIIPITFTNSNPSVATVSPDGTIHIISAGTTTITVNQEGNTLFNRAVPQSQVLIVLDPVIPVVTITPDKTSICAGSSVVFTAVVNNVNSNLSYQWQVNNINRGINSASLTYTPLTSSDVIKCVVTNVGSCQATGNSTYSGIMINPNVSPYILISSSATSPVCNSSDIIFLATATNEGSNPIYQWKVNGLNKGANSPSYSNNSLNNGDLVSCFLTANNNCLIVATASSNSVKALIVEPNSPLPSLTITPSANNVYLGTLVTFTAVPANAGTITNYQWQLNGVNVGTNSPIYRSSTFGNLDEITCTITSDLPCTVPTTSLSTTLIILPPMEITIPNTFTPNGDGINDVWKIPALLNYPNCMVSVFDRYGNIVFKSKGYDNPWGGFFNGEELQTATYYYIVDPADTQKALSGYVMIVK